MSGLTRFEWALLLTVAILGVGWWLASAAEHDARVFSRARADEIETIVRNRLDAPSSAEFASVRFYEHTNGGCGLVDARTGSGDADGLVGFVVTSSRDVYFEPQRRQGLSPRQLVKHMQARYDFFALRQTTCPDYSPFS